LSDLIERETIIYFGPEPWAGLWRNRHQLMSRLATHNDVWYVEPPTLLRDLLGLSRRRGGNTPRPRTRLFSQDDSGVRVFHSPWWLPYIGRDPFRNISLWFFLKALSIATGSGKSRRPVVWYSRPSMIEYVDKMPAKVTIYHVVDEYSGYGHPSKSSSEAPGRQESQMLQSVDHVIVVTPSLYERKSPYNPSTHVVSNAVDYEAYADDSMACPDDMSEIRHPIIGYSGLVAARLDLDLLINVASARPAWSFVFVGSVKDDYCGESIRKLRKLPNVHLLGFKPVQEVPNYVQQFDVCIIPYVVNLRAEHASPLKLYEYAAASKPIVTTNFEAARAFEGQIEIADNPDEFIRACGSILNAERPAVAIAGNRLIAAENTWDHRIRQISAILADSITDQ